MAVGDNGEISVCGQRDISILIKGLFLFILEWRDDVKQHTVTLGVIIGVIWDCHTFVGGKVNY